MILPPPHQSLRVAIDDPSSVGDARRLASNMAQALGFAEVEVGKAALIVTEAATNIIAHAQRGEVLLRVLREAPLPSLEMLALDRGPGMADVSRCIEDGYSTAGTSGSGLGSIKRAGSGFEIYSVRAGGTVVRACIGPAEHARAFEWGAVCVAFQGEAVCGDGYRVSQHGMSARLVIVDGLGHGQGAADATHQLLTVAAAHDEEPCVELLQRLHRALRGTRGAAAGIVDLALDRAEVRFVGVGNCSAAIVGGARPRNFVSHTGTLGANVARFQEFSLPWPEHGLLIAYTDGLSQRWDLEAYPGLATTHPSVIAAVLYRDFARPRDDATVVVVRRTNGRRPHG